MQATAHKTSCPDHEKKSDNELPLSSMPAAPDFILNLAGQTRDQPLDVFLIRKKIKRLESIECRKMILLVRKIDKQEGESSD